jgi:acyl carrier protein phosphodiesterase
MNFLAHLWLTEAARLPLAGAVLGDVVRGRLEHRFPEPLERSIRWHRRVDALTDRHPRVVATRERFAPGARRYAGIVLDLMYDHALARGWAGYSDEPLEHFTARAAASVAAEAAVFAAQGCAAPTAAGLRQLLLSYRETAGIERAVRRVAARLREPQRLLEAAHGWQLHQQATAASLPELLQALRAEAQEFRG